MPSLDEQITELKQSSSRQETLFAAAFTMKIAPSAQSVCLAFLKEEEMCSISAFENIDTDDWIDEAPDTNQKSALKTGHMNSLKALALHLKNKGSRTSAKIKTAANLRDALQAKGPDV